MGGKPSKHAKPSDEPKPSTVAVTKKDSLSKLPNELMGHISEYLTPEEEARLRIAKPKLTLKTRGMSSFSVFFHRHWHKEQPIRLVREGIHYQQDGIDFLIAVNRFSVNAIHNVNSRLEASVSVSPRTILIGTR